ncbi:Endo-alpha-N-acetylgalactosaminidase precursor [Anaerohalosphaera lusitana]|uniref:Endo-alpha-N-acetylgalactosaminidase n=1 Tax=Anaerohalosphaera lusitana TaxID=1936003 RepID=A0A1U9NJR6_9BACT|nr:endo-alpha-N-acetylgalactosaminidase family protein [Anaerohalosphaera lusitana]AQT68159.1 Endo-alpha-N-acetylgalactosaminidase precursor [Anaerohalosphaera lusitana]
MSRKSLAFLSLVLMICLGAAGAAETATIESDVLAVEVDTAFPRVVKYTWKESGAVMYGQENELEQFKINGEAMKPAKIEFSRSDDSAKYAVRARNTRFNVVMNVAENVLEFRITDIRDGGWHYVKTIEIPNHSLFSVRSDQPGAQVTAAKVWPSNGCMEEFVQVASAATDVNPVSRTYVLLNTDELAASIENNVLMDSSRVYYQTVDNGGYKSCGVSNPAWTYREIESEIYEEPYCKVVITDDVNGDDEVSWQDAAIEHRKIMYNPQGAEEIKTDVVSQIAMNFASLAQHPFLKVLDDIKMVYLYTDGLGQTVQFKGYQSEGHDSAHPDYGNNFNMRAGGLDDFNFVTKKLHDWNCKPGVHINCTEYYPEAKYYSDDLLTGRRGWAWLDQSIYADKRYDIVSGKLYHRLDELAENAPYLDWIYVDVYFGVGWDSWKLTSRLNDNGWDAYTEFEGMMERDAVWIHRSQKHAGLGVSSKVIRFIKNHQKDVWTHGPLLRGSYNLGFMGWHAENNINPFIYNVFTNNLPSKYMQHFEIMKWEDGRVDFTDGVHVAKEADGKVNLYKDGKLLASGVYDAKKRRMVENQLFIPWSPYDETKIYHWNDAGGETEWTLPASWSGAGSVKLYQLSDAGRTFVGDVDVSGGKVTLDVEAGTPYVVYKSEPKPYPDMKWGEGQLVKDAQFNSHGFEYWSKSSSAGSTDHITMENDERGQTHLNVAGNGGADAMVSQKMTGLEGGQRYSASVWAQITGERKATFGVKVGGEEISKTIRKTDVPNYSYCSDKAWTRYQRIRVFFTVPEGQSEATVFMAASEGGEDAVVEFDDVRVIEAPAKDNNGHWYYQDFEWTDEGWGPFVFAIRSDTHTHLSETHEPYTDDTINGQFSLKTRNERQGLVYRTTEGLLRFEPNTTYTVSFEYLQDNGGQYSVVVGSNDGGEDAMKVDEKLQGSRGRYVATFTTGDYDDCYIGIRKNDRKGGRMVMDDLAIDVK